MQWNHQYNYQHRHRRRQPRANANTWYDYDNYYHPQHARQRRGLDLDVINCSAELIEEEAEGMEPDADEGLWALTTVSPYAELYLAVRAITPLLVFLLLVFKFALKEPLPRASFGPPQCQCTDVSPLWGVASTLVGLFIFNVGLTYGLSQLGNDVGERIPALFTTIDDDGAPLGPFHDERGGQAMAAGFAFVLGLGATLAEPALNQLGKSTEEQTGGKFTKMFVVLAVAAGVATGVTTGVLKLITLWTEGLYVLLYVGYAVAAALTLLSTNDFVCVGWDSAGVTTGPITVPLVLALGLGIGKEIHAVDAFGLLSMASIGPILSVLASGIVVEKCACCCSFFCKKQSGGMLGRAYSELLVDAFDNDNDNSNDEDHVNGVHRNDYIDDDGDEDDEDVVFVQQRLQSHAPQNDGGAWRAGAGSSTAATSNTSTSTAGVPVGRQTSELLVVNEAFDIRSIRSGNGVANENGGESSMA